MPVLELNNLYKQFDDGTAAVDGICLQVEPGEIVSLLGASGCGKTTTLRSVAGLETPTAGQIVLNGRTVFDREYGKRPRIDVATEKRDIAMVFQQYALWPHLSIFENVAFGLRSQKIPRAQIAEKVQRALQRVGLWERRDRRISQLSGGQQQRIALARAFASDPAIVLFDEPLSNLDMQLRHSMRLELLDLQQDLGFAAIYVTHDQEEAFALSRKVAVMHGGRVEQFDSPTRIWTDPASPAVAAFMGSTNRLGGTVASVGAGDACVEVDHHLRLVVERRDDVVQGDPVDVFIKFTGMRISESAPAGNVNVWEARIRRRSFFGEYTLLRVDVNGLELNCKHVGHMSESLDHVFVELPVENIHFYPKSEAW